jgi:hypothetical protein
MSVTSGSYGTSIGWSSPFSKETGVTVRIITEQDGTISSGWTKDGKVFSTTAFQDRAMLYARTGYAKRDGGPWQSRVWWPVGKSDFSFAVLGDSGIRTPYDLKPGMKILYIPFAPDGKRFMEGLLAWGQVDPEDVVFVPASSTVNLGRNLMDGNGVVTLGWPTSSYWVEVEASPHGLAWIELDAENDPEGAKRYLEFYPFHGFGISTSGPPSAIGVPMASSMAPYITTADTDPELIYNLCKWLDENYDIYKDAHPWSEYLTAENLIVLAKSNYEPLHDGSVRFLEEKGLWTEELETRRQYNIEQLTKWVDGYQAAIGLADDKGLQIDPDDEEWQEFWANYRKSNNLPLLKYYQEPGDVQTSFSDFFNE